MNLYDIIKLHQDPMLGDYLRRFTELYLPEFRAVIDRHTGSALGGISNAEAFWLYFLIKAVRPKQIIESGTYYGYSMHFIRAAVDWPCRIMSFDPDLSNAPRLDGVEYHGHDWQEEAGLDYAVGKGTMVFFDDHIDQDRRMCEAIFTDQEHIVFHDNYLSLEHSHKPIRFCDLGDARFCYTFPALYSDPVFTDTEKNAQTYRWLTYVQR